MAGAGTQARPQAKFVEGNLFRHITVMSLTASVGLMAIVGFGAGVFMNLGGRWMATVVVMIVLALIVQAFIWLFGVLL